jgi:predicted glycosyltransferase involved in capsule biosynthesis
MIILSFCISIKNRKYQLEQTLLKNLQDSKNDNVEFILVDYGSNDGLNIYIYENFKEYIDMKKLKYYYTDELIYWHASIAKNTTHILANGKYIVNLDCDNFIGENGDNIIIDIFEKNGDNIIIHQSDYKFGSGNAGRISLTKDNFIKLGGYDELFYPMGYQDIDLIKRSIKYGLKLIKFNENNNCVINSKKESIKNIGLNITFEQMNNLNMLKSNLNLQNNDIIANKFKNYIGLKKCF